MKEICSVMHMGKWNISKAYHDILNFIELVNSKVESKPIEKNFTVSKVGVLLF